MPGRRCLYCQKTFQITKYQPAQTVCGESDCQRQRRNDYHRRKIATDAEYRLVCMESPRKWRERNPDYWKRYREKNRPPWSRIASNSGSGIIDATFAVLQTTTQFWI